jgi:hypothetical protein
MLTTTKNHKKHNMSRNSIKTKKKKIFILSCIAVCHVHKKSSRDAYFFTFFLTFEVRQIMYGCKGTWWVCIKYSSPWGHIAFLYD